MRALAKASTSSKKCLVVDNSSFGSLSISQDLSGSKELQGVKGHPDDRPRSSSSAGFEPFGDKEVEALRHRKQAVWRLAGGQDNSNLLVSLLCEGERG